MSPVFSRECPACGWWQRRVADDGRCAVCGAALGVVSASDYGKRHPLSVRDRRAVDAIRAMVRDASADASCLEVAGRAYAIAREHGLSRPRAQHLSRRAAELHRGGDR